MSRTRNFKSIDDTWSEALRWFKVKYFKQYFLYNKNKNNFYNKQTAGLCGFTFNAL